MRLKAVPLLAALATLPSLALADVPSPKIGQVELAQPLPLPYDVNANAQADVDAALKRAKANGKRVIVDLGGNWCGDCRVFAGILDVPAVKKFVGEHFEVVLVNVGRYDTNLDIPARFGLEKPKAAPTTLIVSSQGKLLNADDLVALKDARSMTPQAVLDWLAHWAAPVGKA
ncbi:MAG: thioredoxin family protein [Burkholderiales bacterium]|nr:thioredoxin family protein [Burkholderiales bacterium]